MSAPLVLQSFPAGLPAKVRRLLAESAGDDWALITPSVYETARLISISPWLDGHAARLRYICAEQAPDGGWGIVGFRLVPTLSAIECLLAACERQCPADAEVGVSILARTAARGLEILRGWLASTSAGTDGEGSLPDTVAIEFIVPRLMALINAHLERNAQSPVPGLPAALGGPPLPLPAGTAPDLLAKLRRETAAGRSVPDKLWHTWETLSAGPMRPREIPLVGGAVACSPAATAAWLGAPAEAGHPACRFLYDLQRRGGGPVPVATPMPYFERSWMLSVLRSHGVPHTAPVAMLAGLGAALGQCGIGAGPGLPADADDTAVTLHALALNGIDRAPESLMHYFGGDHFLCYPQERTPSPTTNAHAIEALGCRVAAYPGEKGRYGPAIQSTVNWLTAAQHPDGSWTDKWHGSLYYATACCAQALAAYGGPGVSPAVERAIGWILGTQLPNGRWGHGQGTVEETAYAAFILKLARCPQLVPAADRALSAARRVLSDRAASPDPHLWIGKDMYTPLRVAQATCLAARYAIGTPAAG